MTELPPRPHDAPCACEEKCKPWAKLIVGSMTPRKAPPAPDVPAGRPYEPPLGDLLQGLVAKVAKANGKSEEEFREEARRMGEALPEPPPRKYSREAVKARGVAEIHLEHVYDADPTECEALTAVRDFLRSSKSLLVLAGSVGVCKTGSACWALTQKPGLFVTADVLVSLPRANDDDSRAMWRRAREGNVLVLDDLGREYADGKGWAVETITGLVDYRYSNKLKTIITTNLESRKFKADYGERIADRIRESGRFIVVGGKSVRA